MGRFQEVDPLLVRCWKRFDGAADHAARPGHRHETAQSDDFLVPPPGEYLCDGVETGNEVELRLRNCRPKRLQRIDGEGLPLAVYFLPGGGKVLISRNRDFHHCQAMMSRGNLVLLLMGRFA